MKNINRPIHYIRKNRQTEVMIYLKENEQKAAQRLFCHAYSVDCGYIVMGETTSIDEVDNCNVMLVASASMLTRDVDEYYKIEKKLKKKGIRIEVATSEDNAGRYIDLALQLYRKGRI
jgi:hypothetical protein